MIKVFMNVPKIVGYKATFIGTVSSKYFFLYLEVLYSVKLRDMTRLDHIFDKINPYAATQTTQCLI